MHTHSNPDDPDPRILTAFFRDHDVWPLVAAWMQDRTEPITVWCGGCSTGEEAYSAAILLDRLGIDGQVIGTDVDSNLLAAAEAGRYSAGRWFYQIRQRIDARYLRLYFQRKGAAYQVRDEIRRRVTFHRARLGVDSVPSCDLAVCRNVWRFLDKGAQAEAAGQLWRTLPGDGRLLLGTSDLPPQGLLAELFEPDGHDLLRKPK